MMRLACTAAPVDAHGANHGAAPALAAGVVDEFLGLFEVRQFNRPGHQAVPPTQRADRAVIDASVEVHLAHGRVLGIAHRLGGVLMTGVGALPATDAAPATPPRRRWFLRSACRQRPGVAAPRWTWWARVPSSRSMPICPARPWQTCSKLGMIDVASGGAHPAPSWA